MGIHSNILVHWTGKDIENGPDRDKSQLYIGRLKDDLENGLFAKRTSEATVRRRRIKNLIRICFTEIRLSQAQTHANRYGKLGIGFTRDFIVERGGRPVIYIPFDPPADTKLLEDSIENAYNRSEDNEEVHRAMKWIQTYVKRMSNKDRDDLYAEMEWRLVYDEHPKNKHFVRSKDAGVYRLRFEASDIKVIIFPDENVKRKSLTDETISRHLSERMPIMATLADCENF